MTNVDWDVGSQQQPNGCDAQFCCGEAVVAMMTTAENTTGLFLDCPQKMGMAVPMQSVLLNILQYL